MKNLKKTSILNLFLGLFFFACGLDLLITEVSNQDLSIYGKEFNVEREKRGIPIIPDGWDSFASLHKRIWENPIWDKTTRIYGLETKPLIIHYQKTVSIRDDNSIEEADVYLGDYLGLTPESEEVVLERIIITCIYSLEKSQEINCFANIRTRDLVYLGRNVDLAKKILAQWDIQYP